MRRWVPVLIVVVVGIVLSPLRAAAATIPTLIAYDAAIRSTATTALGRLAVRPMTDLTRTSCDNATFGYDDSSNRPSAPGVRRVPAYDDALNLAERREQTEEAIYGATATTAAAEGVEGVALAEGQAASAGMQAHHIFPQAAEFASKWEEAGINIEQFRVQLTEGTHLGQLHGSAGIPGLGPGGLWNATWRSYFAGEAAAGRAITQQGLFMQAGQMLGDFGVPYFTPIAW
jgi:Predicted lipoprotein of unknown function (DUF2380)